MNGSDDRLSERRQRVGVRHTILVVEKETAIRELILEMLHGQGFEVWTSASTHEALQIQDRGHQIDLLLTEAYPDGASIQELLRLLRQQRPQLQMLIMSGKFDEGFAAMLGDSAHRLFLLKPFTTEVLLRKISDILD